MAFLSFSPHNFPPFFIFNLKISDLWEQFLLQEERSCQVNADSTAGAG